MQIRPTDWRNKTVPTCFVILSAVVIMIVVVGMLCTLGVEDHEQEDRIQKKNYLGIPDGVDGGPEFAVSGIGLRQRHQ